MPHTQILFRDQARARILAGATLLAEIEDAKQEAQPDRAAAGM